MKIHDLAFCIWLGCCIAVIPLVYYLEFYLGLPGTGEGIYYDIGNMMAYPVFIGGLFYAIIYYATKPVEKKQTEKTKSLDANSK